MSADTTPVGSRRKAQKQKSFNRKKIEDVFPVKIPHKIREDNGYLLVPVDVERKLVDVDGLKAGMFRLRFLVNGSQPGSIPDPKIVASMLDLVRSLFIHNVLRGWNSRSAILRTRKIESNWQILFIRLV